MSDTHRFYEFRKKVKFNKIIANFKTMRTAQLIWPPACGPRGSPNPCTLHYFNIFTCRIFAEKKCKFDSPKKWQSHLGIPKRCHRHSRRPDTNIDFKKFNVCNLFDKNAQFKSNRTAAIIGPVKEQPWRRQNVEYR